MDVKRYPITYINKNEVNLINNGNIKMEEDFIFESSNIVTNMKGGTYLSLNKAIDELYKYYSNQN